MTILKATTARVAIDAVKPYRGNPRRGNIALIAESLETNGQYRPIVVRKKTSEIVAGNHTWEAARALGWTHILATTIDVDAQVARRIVAVDNAAADAGTYDGAELAALLDKLPDLTGTGYDDASLRALLASLDDEAKGGKVDPNEIPERPRRPRTKTGDLWTLGDHRVLCGTVVDLEPGAFGEADQIDAVWTDPPYNVEYHADTGGVQIEGDAMEPDTFAVFLERAFRAAATMVSAGAPIYSCAPQGVDFTRHQGAMQAAGWEHKQTLIWVKSHFAMGRQDYQYQHEPILYGWLPGAGHRWFGGHDKISVVDEEANPSKLDRAELIAEVERLRLERNATVARFDKPHRHELHPTAKPVELVAHHIGNSTVRGDRVLDPFAGGGATLIACEQLGRRARCVELEPGYVDVIVKRWERFTGKKAKRRAGA